MESEHPSVKPDIPDGGSYSTVDMEGNILTLEPVSDIASGVGLPYAAVDMEGKILTLEPVSDNASGVGLPYAPVDWPTLGDVWKWRVGKRKSASGFMLDRYLYPPNRFLKMMTKKTYFDSFQSLKEFVQREFPNIDRDAFFSSFSWKIPAKDFWGEKDTYVKVGDERYGSESRMGMKCKARNRLCPLQLDIRSNPSPVMECDLCCSESGFCRDCCCILCLRCTDRTFGGYSFVRCEAIVGENSICGHTVHIDCALRSYLAGTVGGKIGLDAEYLCRRCDNRTDLIPHVTSLLETCKSLQSGDDIGKILKVGLCILRGSQRQDGIGLHHRIELALKKLTCGICPKEIWNVEDVTSSVSPGAKLQFGSSTNLSCLEDTNDHHPHEPDNMTPGGSQQSAFATSDHEIESLKLDEEVDQVLQDLRTSQELEYRMAQEKFNDQKRLLVSLHQQLDAERSELSKRTASTRDCDIDAHLTNIMNRVKRIKEEAVKFDNMLVQVAKGFGTAPPHILKEHFGFQTED